MSAGQSRGMSGVGSLPLVDGDVPVTICRNHQLLYVCETMHARMPKQLRPTMGSSAPRLSRHARHRTPTSHNTTPKL